jgi:hypothetical protein
MTRSERQRRAFPLVYAATLALAVGGVEVAKAQHHAAPAIAAPRSAPTVAMARPPKPEVHRPTPSGDADAGGSGYTLDRCGAMSGDLADACFAAVARDKAARDPQGGLDACARVSSDTLRFECMADVAEGHARVDVAWSRGACETIPRKTWRDQCVFGIANALALVDADLALKTCEDSGQWRPFCRHDVNGERATVDPESAIRYCHALPPAHQPTCWHGLGKYIGRRDEAGAARRCADAPTAGDYRGQCYHGLGWAAAERDGAAAAARCERYGDGRDSCILGVAYQQKPFDPDVAASLCRSASDPAEQRYCLQFVTAATH